MYSTSASSSWPMIFCPPLASPLTSHLSSKTRLPPNPPGTLVFCRTLNILFTCCLLWWSTTNEGENGCSQTASSTVIFAYCDCPSGGCEEIIAPSVVKELVTPAVFDRYDKLLLQQTLDSMQDVIYSPRPSFSFSDQSIALLLAYCTWHCVY